MFPIKAQSPFTQQYPLRSFISCLTTKIIHISISQFYIFRTALSANSTNKERFRLLIHYHHQKSRTMVSWHLFGKHLIAPSINIEKKETLIKPIQQEKFDKFFYRINRALIASKPIGNKRTRGVCLGASLSFLKCYLREKQAGYNAKEAFAIAAQKHSNGISEKTCIKHGLQKQITRRGLASFFQLKLKIGKCYENEEAITKTIDKLRHAAYEVRLSNNKKSTGHSIVFIKEKEQVFIYDSNYGSAIYPAASDKKILLKLMKHYKYDQMRFSLTGLSPRIG